MTKVMMWVVALLAVAIGGAFMNLVPPLSWAWGAALVVLTFVGTLAWLGYTLPKSPDKVASFIAKYVPKDIAAKMFEEGSGWFENLRAKLRYDLQRLGKL